MVRVPPNKATVVNVTQVEVSPDLRYADVYITALDHAPEAVKYLSSKRFEIKKDLKRELSSLYVLPSVRFRVDTQSERLTKLDRILDTL